jgi:predicted dehydrogenase
VRDSPVQNAGAHFLATAFFLAGAHLDAAAEPTAVAAACVRAYPIETCDAVAARFTTSTGVAVVVNAAHCLPDEGTVRLRLDCERGPIEAMTSELPWAWTCAGRELAMMAERHGPSYAATLAAVRGQPARLCTLALARPHAQAIELLHRADPGRPADPARVRDDGTRRWLDGLGQAMEQAWQAGVTVPETGYDGLGALRTG